MKGRRAWIAAAALIAVLAGGGLYYGRGRPEAAPQRAGDPGLAVVLAIGVLERDPQTRLTKDQITAILPLVKVLKDVPATDEAGSIIARAVRDRFSAEQRAALDAARRRLQDRRAQGAPGAVADGAGTRQGVGGGPGGRGMPGVGPAGAAISDEQRAQVRTRAFEKMIDHLERRMD
jgi:hypothetical protein